jgi:hypothetical protein
MSWAEAKAAFKNIEIPSYPAMQGTKALQQTTNEGAKLIEDILKAKPKAITL